MTTTDRLDARALQRVSGPAWAGLKSQFLAVSDDLLACGPECWSELTTIYVKFWTGPKERGSVFAVAWLKQSSELVIGLAVPEDHGIDGLSGPPRGKSYPGLHGYLTIKSGGEIPVEFANWARQAFAAPA